VSTDHAYNPSALFGQQASSGSGVGGGGVGGGGGAALLGRRGSTKKASLFAWCTLQSIPEETIISPHILEFLEQTLEPIPSSLQTKSAFANAGES